MAPVRKLDACSITTQRYDSPTFTDNSTNMRASNSPSKSGKHRITTTSLNSHGIIPFLCYIEPYTSNTNEWSTQGTLGLEKLRTLSLHERQALIQGDSINIFIGDDWAFKMPWHLFRAMSTKAAEIDPARRELHLPANLSKLPFSYILQWLKEVTTTTQFYLIKRRNSVMEDVAVCRAARLLGMMEYCQHIFSHYWTSFESDNINYEHIAAIEQLAMTEEKLGLVAHDAQVFLTCIANRFGKMLIEKNHPDDETLDTFLDQHWKLRRVIAEVVEKLVDEEKPGRNIQGATQRFDMPQQVQGRKIPGRTTVWERQADQSHNDAISRWRSPISESAPCFSYVVDHGIPRHETLSNKQGRPEDISANLAPGKLWNNSVTATSLNTHATTRGTQQDPTLPRLGFDPLACSFSTMTTDRIRAVSSPNIQVGEDMFTTPWNNKHTKVPEQGHDLFTSPPISSRQQNQEPSSHVAMQTHQLTHEQAITSYSQRPQILPDNLLKLTVEQIAQTWAQNQVRALREQNMRYREERYRANFEASFKFSNVNWEYDPPAMILSAQAKKNI